MATVARHNQANRSNLFLSLKIVSVVFAAMVLVQAIVAGRGWFKDFSLISTHGQIGEFMLLIAIAQVVLAYLVYGPRHTLTVVSAIVVLLTIAQIGLGFSSRDNATSASLHIPNGVLIFGLSTVLASRIVSGNRAIVRTATVSNS